MQLELPWTWAYQHGYLTATDSAGRVRYTATADSVAGPALALLFNVRESWVQGAFRSAGAVM